MRHSKRTMILDAVVALIERDGVTSVTFDAVAEETGITRGGLIYHFPSRENLILATHKHLAGDWEARMERMIGKSANEATSAERQSAYVQTGMQAARRAELLLMLESADDPELAEVWRDVLDRWAPPAPENGDRSALMRFIARLAADGLWSYEALFPKPLPSELKELIGSELMAMTAGKPHAVSAEGD